MSCVNILFNTDYYEDRKDEIKVFDQSFENAPDDDSEEIKYYKYNLFENLSDTNEESNGLNDTHDFILARVTRTKDHYQRKDLSEGLKIHGSVLMLGSDCNEKGSIEKIDKQGDSFEQRIYNYINDPRIQFDLKIPLIVLCISSTRDHPNIRALIKSTDQLLRFSNRFIHFMFGVDEVESYSRCISRIASIGILLSPNFDLNSLDDKNRRFVSDKILFEKFQSNRGVKKNKNIAHLIAKMDVAWAVNRLCNYFPNKNIFRLFMEKDTCHKCKQRIHENNRTVKCYGGVGSDCSMQNPLMIAARHTKKAVLASFMNFYSSNIDMTELHDTKCKNKEKISIDCDNECRVCIIKHLLHETDSRGKNLTYYIIVAQVKCLGAYGTILQFEEDFHIRKRFITKDNKEIIEDKEDKDYLLLQSCIQMHVGSSLQANQVLQVFQTARTPKMLSIILTVASALLGLYLFQMGLYLMDVITDSLVAQDYYRDWKSPNSSSEICQWNPTLSRYVIVSDQITSNVTDLKEYPKCLSDMWKFLYTTGFMLLPTLFYLIEMLRHYARILKTRGEKIKEGIKTDEKKSLIAYVQDLPIWVVVPIGIVAFPLLTPFWPLILFALKSYPLAMFHCKSGTARRYYWERFEAISLIILVVHLIEVCIESSFMAILQWYTVMPEMLHDFHGYFVERESENHSLNLSRISFIFSILSLAWGFTTYAAEQKDGALDLTWNPAGRILLFCSNLCLIFARINSLVLFMYFWGPGEFKPGMIWIFIHVLLMMCVHYYTLYYRMREDDKTCPEEILINSINDETVMNVEETSEKERSGEIDNITNQNKAKDSKKEFMYYLTVFYVCLVNGLANIFVNNFVNISLNKFKHIGAKKKKTFYRQVCGDLLFFLQNVVMVSLGLTIDLKPMNDPITSAYIAGVIFGCHFLGLLIKVVYYKYFHIWKDLTPRVRKDGIKRGLEKSEFKDIKKNLKKRNVELKRKQLSGK